MNKYSPKTYTVKNLEKLLEKHGNFLMEADRHRQMVTDLAFEEKKLVAETEVNSAPEKLNAIGAVRLKREFAPKKIAEFEQAADAVLSEIGLECQELIDGMNEILAEKYSQCFLIIYSALWPFFFGRDDAARHEVKVVIQHSNFGERYHRASEFLKSDGLNEKAPLFKAAAVLDISKRSTLIEMTGQSAEGLWGEAPKSAEKHEDEELDLLLSVSGRQERFHFLVEKGLPMADAEKTIEGRIAHLRAEQKQRGLAKR
jgi:hypothetical protein